MNCPCCETKLRQNHPLSNYRYCPNCAYAGYLVPQEPKLEDTSCGGTENKPFAPAAKREISETEIIDQSPVDFSRVQGPPTGQPGGGCPSFDFTTLIIDEVDKTGGWESASCPSQRVVAELATRGYRTSMYTHKGVSTCVIRKADYASRIHSPG